MPVPAIPRKSLLVILGMIKRLLLQFLGITQKRDGEYICESPSWQERKVARIAMNEWGPKCECSTLARLMLAYAGRVLRCISSQVLSSWSFCNDQGFFDSDFLLGPNCRLGVDCNCPGSPCHELR